MPHDKGVVNGKPDWYVLTGAPASGKTTLLRRIAGLGYDTVPEAAMTFLEKHNDIPISVLRKDEREFQLGILKAQLVSEQRAPKDRPCLFDRGVPDSIPYLRLARVNTSYIEAVSSGRYRKVFFLEPLPIKFDDSRTEGGKQVEFSRITFDVYQSLGYEVVMVPPMPVGQRMRIVLNHTKRD